MSPGSPVLVLGARSDIALATARRFAQAGHSIQLAARNCGGLERDRADIALRFNVAVTLHEFDALATDSFGAFIAALPQLPEVAVCAVGALGEQARLQTSLPDSTMILRTNFEGPALILGLLANHFETRGIGTIVGISSVAGERGRASNYVYGSAKAGFTAFLSGLRNRLARSGGVHVVTVLPGFVATRMTEGMRLPALLTARPEEVAEATYRAVVGRKNTVYVRRVWGPIMTIIRALPELLFKKMSL